MLSGSRTPEDSSDENSEGASSSTCAKELIDDSWIQIAQKELEVGSAFVGEGEHKRRVIYGCMENLEENEIARLKELRQYWEDNKIEDPLKKLGEKADETQRLRYLTGNASMQKATKQLQEYADWRTGDSFPVEWSEVAETALKSSVYVHGRDTAMRPVIVMRGSEVQNLDAEKGARLLIYILETCLEKLFLTGKVEQWSVILDLRGLWTTSLPFGLIQKMVPLLQTKYKARLWKLYILGMPYMLSTMYEGLKMLCEPTTISKFRNIQDVDALDCELKADILPKQLEIRFGGEAPNVEKLGVSSVGVFPPAPYFSKQQLTPRGTQRRSSVDLHSLPPPPPPPRSEYGDTSNYDSAKSSLQTKDSEDHQDTDCASTDRSVE